MTIKYRTALAPRSQYSSRDGVDVDTFQVHHMAARWPGGLSTLTGTARVVSSTWAVGDGEIVLNVPLDMRPFVSGSPYWDKRSESAEVANSRTGDASGWPVADEDFDNLARVIADWSRRRGVPINDDTVLTHQELNRRHGASYPTACPGGLQKRKAELLRLANKYRSEVSAASAAKQKYSVAPFEDGGLVVTSWPQAIYRLKAGDRQADVAKRHGMTERDFWALNGVNTARGFGKWPVGLRVKVDLTSAPLQYTMLKRGAGPVLTVAQTQRRLKTVYPSYAGHLTIDGIFGGDTETVVKEHQRRAGLEATGIVNWPTWKSIHGYE